MIHFIQGRIVSKLPGMVVIENGGIGYEVNVPEGSPAFLKTPEEITSLYTAMIVREDDISLYGFADEESLSMFRLLMTVSGIGAKGALSILSTLSVQALKQAIVFEDVAAISKANGVGKKTAQRVVIDLKDKVNAENLSVSDVSRISRGSNKDQAVQALIALGYSRSEAMAAMVGITDSELSVQEYIKAALKNR